MKLDLHTRTIITVVAIMLTVIALIAGLGTAAAQKAPSAPPARTEAGAVAGQFEAAMKSLDAANNALRKMEKPTGPAASKAANEIAGAYQDMQGFWQRRKAEDAVKLSNEGFAQAVGLAFAANPFGGDPDDAKARLNAINATCKPCHETHREKLADGRYRIK